MEGIFEALAAIGEMFTAVDVDAAGKKKSATRYGVLGCLMVLFMLVAGIGLACWLWP